MKEVTQIETLTLRDYIDKEMTKHRNSCLEILGGEASEGAMLKVLCENARNVALQEMAYRLEYGFITEIGHTSLKHHLAGGTNAKT